MRFDETDRLNFSFPAGLIQVYAYLFFYRKFSQIVFKIMDYLTEEELYELQYEDDMDALNELDSVPGNTFKKSKLPDPPTEETVDINPSPTCNTNDAGKTSKIKSFLKKCKKRLFAGVEVAAESDTYTIDNAIEIYKQQDSTEVMFITDKPEAPHDGVDSSVPCDAEYFWIQKRHKRSFSEVEEVDEISTCYMEHKKQKLSAENSISDKNFMRFYTNSDLHNSQEYKFEQLPVTKSDGSKVFFRLCEEEEYKNSIFSYAKNTSNLLVVPISTLKDKINLELDEKLAREISNEENKILGDEIEILREEIVKVPRANDELWVEKYRPRCYMDLLSDEGINKTLLFWLKLWDKVVFGKENKKLKERKPVPEIQHQQPTKFKKTFKELMEEPDEHGRPHYKVAFLCGPPGLGKTTLAHVIASHAGYNIVEFNASDDRNPDIFRVNLEAATQMKSVLDRDPRPNCLVIDEIDGAPALSINVLLSFIKSIGFVKGKRKKGDLPLLKRPIICVCNDSYAPALKSLKQLAFVLNFPPTASRRLASRLHEITVHQCLKADINALILLSEKACNDIRSCLSTMQFVFNRKKTLSISDINGMEIGMKDVQKSLFSVWLEVFYLSKNTSSVSRTASDEGIFLKNDYSLKTRFRNLLQTVQTCAEYEKLVNGLFENYLNINFKGSHLEKLWQGPEWLCFADLIQQNIAHSQLYTLMPYLPYVPAAFHVLFVSSSYPKISYPSSFYEVNIKRTQFTNILTGIVNEVVATIKGFLNSTVLILDLLPALVDIIKPTLRPVSTQLYSEREKIELRHVIEVMIAFNLNYRQERSAEGQYSYALDPNIEELVHFAGLKTRHMLTYSTKQLISREVELEKLRRSDVPKNGVSVRTKTNFPLNQLPIKTKKTLLEKPSLDFFGRKIKQKVNVTLEDSLSKTSETGIWFNFKEGYSNAVRRTVWIQDLL